MRSSLNTATAASCLMLLLANGPAAAQDASDWDYGEDAAKDLAIAAVTFENFGVAVRCMGENLSVVMSGLPVGSGERTLGFQMGGEPAEDSRWVSDKNSASAFAVWPRAMATSLSRGGRLSLAVPDGNTTRRLAVDLPASTESVGRVFRACGRQLDASNEEEAPTGDDLAGLVWVKRPEISFPDRARYEGGLAAVLCSVRGDGRLRDCTVESEFPEGSGFGRAATYGAHRTAEVAPAGGSGARMDDRKISFVTRYSLADPGVAPPPSRLPDRDEVSRSGEGDRETP